MVHTHPVTFLQQSCEVGVIIPTLWKQKLRLREVKSLPKVRKFFLEKLDFKPRPVDFKSRVSEQGPAGARQEAGGGKAGGW